MRTRTEFALALAFAGSVLTTAAAAPSLPSVPSGFTIERIATVRGARELAAAPNGDLFIGTGGKTIELLPNAQANQPGLPHTFARFEDGPAAGVALGDNALYVGTPFGVYRIPYAVGDRLASSAPEKLATVRTSGGFGIHRTTSVAVSDGVLYASVGSSCNACRPELDDTRATIQRIDLRTGTMSLEARNIRNAIALTVDPQTHALWAGVAGQDDLPVGHPYEIFDAVTLQTAPVDYGWPSCYENRQENAKRPGSCDQSAIPRVILPAYETPIGAVFYPANQRGPYAFPLAYRGGAFLTLHGSWHGPAQGLAGFVPPRVVFVPMHGDRPDRAPDWSDPTTQWQEFVSGYQRGESADRIGRPTGITVGTDGSLFLADDLTGAIYRIRPR